MNLSMTVVAPGDTIVGTRFHDLLELELAIVPARLRKTRLQEAAATAATVVVGLVGGHLYDVFLSHYFLYHVAQIIGNGIAITFSDYLAGILDGELDFSLFIPVGIYLQASLANPFGIVLVD